MNHAYGRLQTGCLQNGLVRMNHAYGRLQTAGLQNRRRLAAGLVWAVGLFSLAFSETVLEKTAFCRELFPMNSISYVSGAPDSYMRDVRPVGDGRAESEPAGGSMRVRVASELLPRLG